jgi:hypothetical protein
LTLPPMPSALLAMTDAALDSGLEAREVPLAE